VVSAQTIAEVIAASITLIATGAARVWLTRITCVG
jgi:hypothetical protein